MQEFLDRESNIRLKNQEITKQVNEALERKQGKDIASRPINVETVNVDEKALDKREKKRFARAAEPNTATTTNESDISPETENRLLKAKLAVMTTELEELLLDRKEFMLARDTSSMQLDSSKDTAKKALRELEQLQKDYQHATKLLEQTTLDNDQSRQSCTRLQKELDLEKQARLKAVQEQKSLDIRLNRAVEELDKSKSQQQQQQQILKDQLDAANQTCQELFQQTKRLQKQKAELLAGFKKQCQLVEILKRQKIHVEAAKILEFTEQEFMRAMN